jgi:hypothetical protein
LPGCDGLTRSGVVSVVVDDEGRVHPGHRGGDIDPSSVLPIRSDIVEAHIRTTAVYRKFAYESVIIASQLAGAPGADRRIDRIAEEERR